MSERLPSGPDAVTPRQREVARLVAEGYTNERIARELGISHDGAKYHVSELLSRLGVQRREEIAAWYREESGAPVRSRWRSLVGAPLAWGAGGVAAVAALVLMIAAFEGALGGSDEQPAPGGSPSGPTSTGAPESAGEFTHEHESAGWEVRATADIGDRDLLVLLYSSGRETAIQLLDRWSGDLVGELRADFVSPPSVGNNARVAHREEAGQLIVSELAGSAPPGGSGMVELEHRVLVFDIAAGLALEAEIAVDAPGEPAGVRAPRDRVNDEGSLALSADERYLYYLAVVEEDSAVAHVVRVIDLEDGGPVVATADLPERGPIRCGRDILPALSQHGASSVIASCPIVGYARVVAPDGSSEPDVDIGPVGMMYGFDDWGDLPAANVLDLATGLTVLYADGSYGYAEGDEVDTVGRALPNGHRVSDWIYWRGDIMRVDDVRLLISYRVTPDETAEPEPPPPHAEILPGFVIFNTETGDIEHDIEREHYAAYWLGDDEVLLVGDGELGIFDLGTLDIDRTFVHSSGLDRPDNASPDRPDWLPLVR